MHATICRSPQEINDDRICEAHTSICRLLNDMVNGRCLYVGKQREALVALRAQVEAEITGTGPHVDLIEHRIYLAITL